MSDHTTISAPILGSRRRRMAMSVAEAANEANIGRDGIYEAIREGRLEARKWGRRTLITDEALRAVSERAPLSPTGSSRVDVRAAQCESASRARVAREWGRATPSRVRRQWRARAATATQRAPVINGIGRPSFAPGAADEAQSFDGEANTGFRVWPQGGRHHRPSRGLMVTPVFKSTASSAGLNDDEWPPIELVLDCFEADLARAGVHANGAASTDPDRLSCTNAPGELRRIKNLNAALDLATAGLPSLPAIIELRDDGTYAKRPAVRGWQHGAETDHGQIRRWWHQWPDAVPGVELSRAGLVVIDADRHGGPDGVAALEQLATSHGGLPAGPVTETPTGGRHYIYRQPIGQPLGNRRGALPLGIDVRGAGGWIVAPGSVRPDGQRWAAMPGTPPLAEAYASAAIPAMPDWLVAIIRAMPHRSRPQRPPRGANDADHYAPSSSDREAV